MKRISLILALASATAWAAAWAAISVRPGTYSSTFETDVPGSPQPMTITDEACISEAESEDLPAVLMRELQAVGSCEIANVKVDQDRLRFDAQCVDDGTRIDTHADITFGSDWFKGTTTTKMGNEVFTTRLSSKWIAAECRAGDEE